MHDPPRQQKQQEQHDQRIEEAGLAEHVERKQAEDRLHLDALQPVGAAGDVGKALRQRFQQQRDAERHHQPGQVDAADDEEAGEKAEHHRDETGHDQRDHRLVDDAVQRHQPRGIGADAEERGVAERDDAGIAEDQIERQREQRQPNDVGHDQIARGKQERAGRREDPERDLGRRASGRGPWHGMRRRKRGHRSAHRAAVRPNRPFGRQIRITIMMV